MKTRFILSVVLIAASLSASAQQFAIPAQPASSVAVNGYAKKSIRPDEIYLAAVLQEFIKDKKTITVGELETSVRNYAEKICNVPATAITVDKPNPVDVQKGNTAKSRILQIKCTDPEQAAEMFAAMDSLGIDRMNVRHITSTKKDATEKEMKTEAVKNAKEKVTLMLAATGDKPGAIHTLTEVNSTDRNRFGQEYEHDQLGGYYYGKKSNYGGRRMNINSSVSGNDDVEVRNIINNLLNYSISVHAEVAAIFLIAK